MDFYFNIPQVDPSELLFALEMIFWVLCRSCTVKALKSVSVYILEPQSNWIFEVDTDISEFIFTYRTQHTYFRSDSSNSVIKVL